MIPAERISKGFQGLSENEIKELWTTEISEYEEDVSNYSWEELLDRGVNYGIIEEEDYELIVENGQIQVDRENLLRLMEPLSDQLWDKRNADPREYVKGHGEELWQKITYGEKKEDAPIEQVVEDAVDQEIITPEEARTIEQQNYEEEILLSTILEADFQTTLDSERSMHHLTQRTPEWDEEIQEKISDIQVSRGLEEKTIETIRDSLLEKDEKIQEIFGGGGIDFVIAYGSSLNGFNIAPDSLLSRTHDKGNQFYEESDIDLLVGLESTPRHISKKHYLKKAAEILYEEAGDGITENPFKIHPSVETSTWLKQTFDIAQEEWIESGGKPEEKIALKSENEDQETNLRYHDWIKTLMRSSGFVPGFWNREFRRKINEGIELITEEDGSLRNDVDFDFKPESRYFGSTPSRPERLQRNHIYGLWEAANRRHNVRPGPEVFHKLLEKDDNRPRSKHRQGQLPVGYLIHHFIEEEFSENELARIFDGRIQDNLVKESDEQDLREFENRLKQRLRNNADVIKNYLPSEYFEDREFSSKLHMNEEEVEEYLNSDDPEKLLYLLGLRYTDFEHKLGHIAADFVKGIIKNEHSSYIDEEEDKGIHLYTLEELLEQKHGEQTEVWDWTEPLEHSEETIEPNFEDVVNENLETDQTELDIWN